MPLGGDSVDGYRAFLEAKIPAAAPAGFEVRPDEVNPALKDFVQVIVLWAAAGGRRGIFSRFGLHKTSAQIELARLARLKEEFRPLIVLPLGVRHEFMDEAEKRFQGDYAVRLRFIRDAAELLSDDEEQSGPPLIYLTNYESVRAGKLQQQPFGFVSLDEAAVLRGFGGTQTFREFMNGWDAVPLRYVATATPSPNEYIELLAYSAFLGVMDVGQAKTRFFKRDSEQADRLTLHAHKEREFWLWVASWALFVQQPSDLGFSDDGYVLPEIDVRWHEVPSDHAAAGQDRDGQVRMFRNAATSLPDAAREKRDSLQARIDKLMDLRAEDWDAHRIIWHDLEAEREAIQRAVPEARAIYGSQDLEVNEQIAVDFKYGRFQELATKPSMSGAGSNFQAHCAWEIFLGIGHKFHDFIQAIHRLVRFGQTKTVRIDLIYTEAERDIRRRLQAKWTRHDEQVSIMAGIIREFGLTQASLHAALGRSIGVARREASGKDWRLINADTVEESVSLPADSVALIVTSIPFSTQYEYCSLYNDFGHNDDGAGFWRQMDYLTPSLLRVLQPGRVAAIHVKDRIVPGGMTGLGFQTVAPFHADTIAHYQRHGFAYLGMKTVVTDVVRENNQTYRLGWTEQCKDGSRMGCGMPEYVLLFRKPPTDRSNGYADLPVTKEKPLCDDHGAPAPFDARRNWKQPVPGTGYSRGRWQFDAHGFQRSSGNRLLSSAELAGSAHRDLYRAWRDRSLDAVYDFEEHVAIAEELDHAQRLPATFMLLPPHSWHPDVWTDVARMRTLNGTQHAKGRELHLCPLQLDIVDRLVRQHSMPGELVFDPFSGLGTVALRALMLGRRGLGIELNPRYHDDAVAYLRAGEKERAIPTLFQLLGAEEAEASPEPDELSAAQ